MKNIWTFNLKNPQNSTDPNLSQMHAHYFYSIFGLLMIYGNGLIIGSILINAHLRRKEYFIILGLAIADIIIGFASCLSGTHRIWMHYAKTERLCMSGWGCMIG